MIECVFCDIVKKKEEAFGNERLFPDVIAFEPLNPVVPGHRLFIPTQHVKDAGDNPAVTGLVMSHAARWAKGIYPAYNLITSAGADATQTVFHLHIHVIPRYLGDGLHLPWTGQVKE